MQTFIICKVNFLDIYGLFRSDLSLIYLDFRDLGIVMLGYIAFFIS